MQQTRRYNVSRLSTKSQVVILSALLASLLTATFAAYGFTSFLVGIGKGNPFALALPISIIGTGFVLLHKLGIDFTYKEEIEQADPGEN